MSTKLKPYKIKSQVSWKWISGLIHGEVEAIYLEKVTETIKGKKITRNGSKENPAYLVKSKAGNYALKLHSELQQTTASRPKMFD